MKKRKLSAGEICYICLKRRKVRQRCWTCILLGRTGKKKANDLIRRAQDEHNRRTHE